MTGRGRVRDALVLAATSVTPAMRRITLGGPDLADFAVAPGSLGPYVKLHVAGPGGRPVVRTYSVRSHDPHGGELVVDMLLHGEGPGAAFAANATPGDRVGLGGPGFIPCGPCSSYILAGDHTGVPAVAQILAALPREASARVVLEVPGPGEEQELATEAAAEIRWLHRPAGAPSRLATAVREGWPARRGDLLVWAGAEAAIARAIRREARTVRGVPADRCQVLNYWKAGQPEGGFSYCD